MVVSCMKGAGLGRRWWREGIGEGGGKEDKFLLTLFAYLWDRLYNCVLRVMLVIGKSWGKNGERATYSSIRLIWLRGILEVE